MKDKIVALMVAAALMADAGAQAQTASKTLGVSARPISTGGVLQACTIDFAHMATDDANGPARPVMLNGSLDARVAGGSMFLTFRLTVNDVRTDPKNGEDVFTPIRPASIALYDAQGLSNVASRIGDLDDDTPGTRATMFLFEERNLEVIRSIVDDHRLTASYNRAEGARDVRFTVDMDASLEDRLDPVSDFMRCMRTISESDDG